MATMLRRLARNLLLLVAVLGLMPGVNEALEQAAELIEHGHPAHTVPGEAHPLAAEHGCTPVQHQCPCHEGQSVDMRGAMAGGPSAENWLTWMLDAERVGRRPASARGPSGNDIAPANRSTAPPTPPANA